MRTASVKQAFNTEKLYAALVDKYGHELVEHYFGDHITKAHALRLRHYLIYSAEEYALLTTMLGQGPELLFSQEISPADTGNPDAGIGRVSCDPGQSQHRQAAGHPGRPAFALHQAVRDCAVLATVRDGKRGSREADLHGNNPSVPDG